MLMLVGLGNPGAEYRDHRHNIGFMAVDAIADEFNFSPERKKFQGLVREGTLNAPNGPLKVFALKPQTFMNESGRSVREAMKFYKIQVQNILVFHDELDLAPAKIRIKTGGGNAGHNGLRSIDSHIGNNFTRVRMGIGHPGDKARVHGHVLGNFSKADQQWLGALLRAIAKCAPELTTGPDKGYARFQSLIANETQPEKKSKGLGNKKTPSDVKKSTSKPSSSSSNIPASLTTKVPSVETKAETESSSGNVFRDALTKLLSSKDD